MSSLPERDKGLLKMVIKERGRKEGKRYENELGQNFSDTAAR
jgi:hypothetical protein